MSQSSQSLINKTAVGSGFTVSLHPLVLINITDHYTRFKLQQKIQNPQVRGALLGTQTGRQVEIFNSYELLFNGDNLDVQYFQEKQEQFKQVFPNLDFLGWYNTGQTITEVHARIHQQVAAFNESPLFLQLDPLVQPTAKALPIVIYESSIDIIDGHPRNTFIEIPYKIETGEAERIAVNHVANVTDSGNPDESRLTSNLTAQKNAIRMLHARAKIALDYLIEVKNGTLPVDHHILREISSLCNRLPIMESEEFQTELVREYNDVLLTTYLATITKGVNSTNELIDKFNMSYEKHGGRRSKGFY